MAETTDALLGLTAQIVSAHVARNVVDPDKLGDLIRAVYRTLASMDGEPVGSAKPKSAVPVSKSIFPEHIVCLEDGRKMKMLKRHLMTDHKLTPEQVPRAMGPAAELSDGVGQLCEDPLCVGEEDWPGPETNHAAQGGTQARRQGR